MYARIVYLGVHFGAAAAVPDYLVPGVGILRRRGLAQRILDNFGHFQFIELERSYVFIVQISVLLRHGLMPLGEPSARRYDRGIDGGLAAAVQPSALGAGQDGYVEAVRTRILKPTALLLRRFGGPAQPLFVLRARRAIRATCVYLRRGRRQGTQDRY